MLLQLAAHTNVVQPGSLACGHVPSVYTCKASAAHVLCLASLALYLMECIKRGSYWRQVGRMACGWVILNGMIPDLHNDGMSHGATIT